MFSDVCLSNSKRIKSIENASLRLFYFCHSIYQIYFSGLVSHHINNIIRISANIGRKCGYG